MRAANTSGHERICVRCRQHADWEPKHQDSCGLHDVHAHVWQSFEKKVEELPDMVAKEEGCIVTFSTATTNFAALLGQCISR